MFNLESWAAQFTTPDDRPSPDWNDPVMAHRLRYEVPRLAYGCGLRPPYGMAEDDWIAELQLTLILRSRGKGKWDPARGRAAWSSWACMVMQTRNANLYRSSINSKANLIRLCTTGMMESGYLESWSGEGVGLQSGMSRAERTAKAAQQRARRAKAASLALD